MDVNEEKKLKLKCNLLIEEVEKLERKLEFSSKNQEDFSGKELFKNDGEDDSTIMIGIAGSKNGIGVTHNTIVLANYLLNQGSTVAVLEYNASNVFENIQESQGSCQKENNESSFSVNGADYYMRGDQDRLVEVLEKQYDFIIFDFGLYKKCNIETYNNCHVKLIIAGTKPWDINEITNIFELADKNSLQQYHFCFNFVSEDSREQVRTGMGKLEKVYFLEFSEDPFESYNFLAADTILQRYLPEQIINRKVPFWAKKRRKIG